MLNVPNLDDQRYEQILENAVNGIPFLYDQWTDFNEHDPGITLLELFAWYKQMQQYHLNRVTDHQKLKLLKMLGIEPEGLRETKAMVHFSEEMQGQRFPRGTRLISEGGVGFELNDTVTTGGIIFREAFIRRGDGMHEVTSVLIHKQIPLKINEGDVLYIGIDGLENKEEFRLWFDIDGNYPVRRNPFEAGDLHPRTIRLEAIGVKGPVPLAVTRDETFSLSFSGAMSLYSPGGIPATDGAKELPVRCWLMLQITEPGCEEDPAILSVTADYAAISQRTTKSEVNEFTAEETSITLELDSWLAINGKTDVYIRDGQGWYEIRPKSMEITNKPGARILRLELDLKSIAFDTKSNIRVICYEQPFRTEMRQNSTGLPNQYVKLPLTSGEQPLPDNIHLMCRSGSGENARYHDWKYMASLEDALAHERVFSYDDNLGLVFGDNRNGAVLEPGSNAVYLAGFALTEGGEGSITDGQKLFLTGRTEADIQSAGPDGQISAGSVFNIRLGRDKETIESAVLSKEAVWSEGRTATSSDFERIAMLTPGRRVAQAKALPLYKPDVVIQENIRGLLTLVVLPYSEKPFPMPDERFLSSVRKHVEKYRVICTNIEVIAPVYVSINISADVIADADEQIVYTKVRRALEDYFSVDARRELGAPVSQSGVLGAIGSVDSVLAVTDIHIGADGNRHRYDKHGDVIIQQHSIAYLGTLELRVSRQ